MTISEARLRRLSERVLAVRHVNGARALGWRRYRQAGCGYGGDWFRLAQAWSDGDKRDVKTDEGLALSWRAVGRLARRRSAGLSLDRQGPDDEVALRRHRRRGVVARQSAGADGRRAVEDFDRHRRAGHSALGAQALGWYRLERGEFDDAARWFKQALDWWPAQRDERVRKARAPAPNTSRSSPSWR